MSISVITRSYRTSELKELISYLKENNETEQELITVCNVIDYHLSGVNLIIENSNRFEARITGINNSHFDKVLLLDSDQIPEYGLIQELEEKKMVRK